MSEAPIQRAPVDWERIEIEYRAGVLSLREIAALHGITHGAVNKRAKRDGWGRDLGAKIKAKADALVSKALVSSEVSAQALVTERQVIEAGAAAIVSIRLAHRGDISKARALCLTLLDELGAVSAERLTIESIHEALVAIETPGTQSDAGERRLEKARDALNKAMSLSSRAGTIKALSDSLKTLVALERQAWGLADASGGDSPGDADEFTKDQAGTAYQRLISGR